MASYYTRSRTRRPGDDVEPDSISSDPLLDSTFVRPSAAGVSVAGACRGVRGWCVLCLLLGARSSRGQCLSGSGGGNAGVRIECATAGEVHC